ncbi:MAG: LTA synthase family protein [Floccifex sp.]
MIVLTCIGSLMVCYLGATQCFAQIHFDDYVDNLMHPSTIYEDYYVDPSCVLYTFPETKRNLIYIFLESMETTYADVDHGGAMEVSYIPELTQIKEENLSFSDGFIAPSLNGWTVAAMVGQTSGLPLNIPINGNSYVSEDSFLSGAYSIGDILEDNGYINELMIGSDAKFGGRKYYFEQHGNYKIVDYFSAIENQWIPEDYYVWWGYEDVRLFENAKLELEQLSSSSQPFNFTLLTVDTHFTGGYYCSDCIDYYGDQYADVIRCSSYQVSQFIAWIQQQPWYENTTIVLAGDHNSMDATWFKAIEESGYLRSEFYTIINSPVHPMQNNNRIVCTYDLFPTTLASLGVSFDSTRLGFGTNLYTEAPTILEIMSLDELNEELSKYSNYYNKNILYAK